MRSSILLIALVLLFFGGAEAKYSPGLEIAEDGNITLDGGEIKNFQADGIVNVKAYGAVGDGSTDDTSAISAAQTAAEASSRKIYLPAGDYYAHGLNFSWGMYNGVIIGDGPRKTRMICNDSEDIFTISAPSITIQDIGFVGNSSRLGKGINIKSGGDNQRILHCAFTDLNYGIYARHDTDMVWDPHVVDCYAERCNYGIFFGQGVWQFLIDSCYVLYTKSGFGIMIGDASGTTQLGAGKILSTTVEYNDGQAGMLIRNAQGISIDSCYFEQNTGYAIVIDQGSQAIDIRGGYINHGTNVTRSGHGVYNNGNVTVDQVIFSGFNSSGKNGISTTAASSATTWIGHNWDRYGNSTDLLDASNDVRYLYT